MITRFIKAGSLLAASLAAALCPLRAEPGHHFNPLAPADVAAISAALPAADSAAPARPRAILVFYRTEGFVHDSIPYINEAIRQLGARTGAFSADFSEDMGVFTPANLARYDAVVFNNTTRLDFKDPAQRAALLGFVKSGKGFVGIHAASDNFYTWPEAQEMLGGLFHDHPWISLDSEAVKIDDPANPVAAAFGRKGFWIREEIYQIMGPYARDRQRVLLSLDMSMAENVRLGRVARTDADFPIAWIRDYGRGRVFYCSIGHNPSITRVPEILKFYLDGIRFAIGDLKADASPPSAPIAPALSTVPGIALQDRDYPRELTAATLEKVAAYDFTPDRVPLVAVDIYLRSQGPKVYPRVEQDLLGLLARPSLPTGARDYCIRTLGTIGSDASVPALTGLVNDPVLGSTAVGALFAIPGHASARALCGALGTARGRSLQSVIGAVGRRRLAGAIPQLARLAGDSTDPQAASAAVTALGNIGTPESLRALGVAAQGGALGATRAQLSAISTVLSDPVAGAGARREIEGTCGLIIGNRTLPDTVRIAALQDLARASGRAALPSVLAQLRDPRTRVRASAANLFARIADPTAIAALATALPSLDADVQAVLINALDARETPGALPLVESGLSSPHAAVRLAAIGALGGIPSPRAATLLIAQLAGDPADSRAASESLGRLRAPGTVEALIAALSSASPRLETAILRILGARADHRVFPVALAAIETAGPAARAAAFAAIAATARRDDLPTVLSLLQKSRNAAERRSMERALLEVVRATPEPDRVVDAINRTLAATRGSARYSLLVALALAGTDHSRAILSDITRSQAAEDRREAINAIAGARDPRLAPLLLAAARNAADPNERILALRSYLDSLQLPSGRSETEICETYAAAWPLASRSEERNAIIAALRRMKTDATDAQAAKLEALRARL